MISHARTRSVKRRNAQTGTDSPLPVAFRATTFDGPCRQLRQLTPSKRSARVECRITDVSRNHRDTRRRKVRDPQIHSFLLQRSCYCLIPGPPRFVPAAPKVNEAFIQGPDFAKPLVVSCLVEPFFGVGGHVLDSACLGWRECLNNGGFRGWSDTPGSVPGGED